MSTSTQQIIEFNKFNKNVYDSYLRLEELKKLVQSENIPNTTNQTKAKKQLTIIIDKVTESLRKLNSGREAVLKNKDEVKNIKNYLKQLEKAIKNPNEQTIINCISKAKSEKYDQLASTEKLMGLLFNENVSLEIIITYKNKENGVSKATITLPKGVTSIDQSVPFEYRSSLVSVIIPKGVTSIETNAFYGYRSLTSIDIPKGVRSIETCAFCNCQSLNSVTIPDGVTSLGRKIFSGCTSLASIEIPDSVIFMASDAFDSLNNLTSLTINAKTPEGYLRVLNMLPPKLQELVMRTEIKNKTLPIIEAAARGKGPLSQYPEIGAKFTFFTAALVDKEAKYEGKKTTPLTEDEKTRDEFEAGAANIIKKLK